MLTFTVDTWSLLVTLAGVASAVAVAFAAARAWQGTVRWFRRRRPVPGLDRRATAARWVELQAAMRSGSPMAMKLATIEADAILDRGLAAMGFPGRSTLERMRAASYRVHGVRRAVWAHKVRNAIVHDDTASADPRTLTAAFRALEGALRDAGIL